MISPNSQQAQEQEQQRRQMLLGPLLALTKFDRNEFLKRARAVDLPPQVLFKWWHQKRHNGSTVSTDELIEIEQAEWLAAIQLHQSFGPAIDNEIIEADQLRAIARYNSWTIAQTRRFVQRYRMAGLWGLTKSGNPFSASATGDSPTNPDRVRDVGTLDEPELEIMFQRYHQIYSLLQKEKLTNRDVADRAEELRRLGVKISNRTLRNYLNRYRKYGKKGLAPLRRGDFDEYRGISRRVVDITKGIRLSQPDLPVRAVYERAEQTAVELGEWPPSPFQARSICEQIPASVKTIADKRQNEFRDKYRLTYGIEFDRVIYQMDHTQIDVLVIDQRSEKYRTQSGEVRPWLTTVIESRSRRVLAHLLGYDQPDRFTVAAAIRQALLCGGIPHEIWVDNGKDLVAQHVFEMARGLGFELKPLDKHQPQQKGRVERIFGVFNTRLWSTLDGYVGSNTVQRNPTAKAKFTIQQVDEILSAFIVDYHQEPHSSTEKSPLEVWQEQCFTAPVDERQLDVLLMEATRRKVIKTGIAFKGRTYWHSELGLLVGREVIVRSPHPYLAPDEIEVFYGEKWVCTAFATDSQRGNKITRNDIASAQRQQKKEIRSEITQARATYQQAIDEAGDFKKTLKSPSTQSDLDQQQHARRPKKSKSLRTSKSKDIFHGRFED